MTDETMPETMPETAPQAAPAATAAPASSDPLSAVADAMQSAASSVSEGASAATSAAQKALPAVGLFANRLVYTTCYTVSYGVVFPLALVALAVPQNNPLCTVWWTARVPLARRSTRSLVVGPMRRRHPPPE